MIEGQGSTSKNIGKPEKLPRVLIINAKKGPTLPDKKKNSTLGKPRFNALGSQTTACSGLSAGVIDPNLILPKKDRSISGHDNGGNTQDAVILPSHKIQSRLMRRLSFSHLIRGKFCHGDAITTMEYGGSDYYIGYVVIPRASDDSEETVQGYVNISHMQKSWTSEMLLACAIGSLSDIICNSNFITIHVVPLGNPAANFTKNVQKNSESQIHSGVLEAYGVLHMQLRIKLRPTLL